MELGEHGPILRTRAQRGFLLQETVNRANITKSVQGCSLKTMSESSLGSLLEVESDEAAGLLPVLVGVTQQKVPPDEGVCVPAVIDHSLDLPFDPLRSEAAALQPGCALIYCSLFSDSSDSVHVNVEPQIRHTCEVGTLSGPQTEPTASPALSSSAPKRESCTTLPDSGVGSATG